MELTLDEVVGYAKAAGFTGTGLRTIVAIAQAESGFDTTAVNPNDPYGGSFGILQINGAHISAISIADMEDPAKAFVFAYSLSRQGTYFNDWSTYTSGKYKTTQAWTDLAIATPPGSGVITWSPQLSLRTWPWLTKDGSTPGINNPYHSSFEASRGGVQDGVGIKVALDTPITSLTAGTVVAANFGQDVAPAGANWNYGGYVIIKSQIPGIGYADVFYRHLDTLSVKQGDTVNVGTELGLSGGQISGGQHPESTAYTTGPHIDIGLNPDTLPFNSIGPNMDPTAWITKLLTAGPPARDAAPIIGAQSGPIAAAIGNGVQNTMLLSDQIVSGTGVVADSFLGIAGHLDFDMQFIPIDWTTASAGIHWWDFVLPWQWAYTSATATANITTAIVHNVGAVALRGLVMTLGFLLIVAFIVGITLTIIAEGAKSEGGQAATQLAGAAAAGAV